MDITLLRSITLLCRLTIFCGISHIQIECSTKYCQFHRGYVMDLNNVMSQINDKPITYRFFQHLTIVYIVVDNVWDPRCFCEWTASLGHNLRNGIACGKPWRESLIMCKVLSIDIMHWNNLLGYPKGIYMLQFPWNIFGSSHIQYECGEYYVEHCQSHITLLWIWIMLWRLLRGYMIVHWAPWSSKLYWPLRDLWCLHKLTH